VKRYGYIILAAALPALALALTPPPRDTATLEANSDEGWCTFYIDGAEVGEIPLNAHNIIIGGIAPGEHFFRVTDAFDSEWVDEVVRFPKGATLRMKVEPTGMVLIDAAEPEKHHHGDRDKTPPHAGVAKVSSKTVPYKQAPCLLIVTSTPAGVAVELDGVDAGVTPLVKTDASAGRHVVAVGDASEDVDLVVANMTVVNVEFGKMQMPPPRPDKPAGEPENDNEGNPDGSSDDESR